MPGLFHEKCLNSKIWSKIAIRKLIFIRYISQLLVHRLLYFLGIRSKIPVLRISWHAINPKIISPNTVNKSMEKSLVMKLNLSLPLRHYIFTSWQNPCSSWHPSLHSIWSQSGPSHPGWHSQVCGLPYIRYIIKKKQIWNFIVNKDKSWYIFALSVHASCQRYASFTARPRPAIETSKKLHIQPLLYFLSYLLIKFRLRANMWLETPSLVLRTVWAGG